MNLEAFLCLKRGLEFDGAGLIVKPPLVGVKNFQPFPFGPFRPLAIGRHVDIVPCLGIVRLFDKVHLQLGVGRVPGPHELFGRLRLFQAGDDRLTALTEYFSTLTRTLHGALLLGGSDHVVLLYVARAGKVKRRPLALFRNLSPLEILKVALAPS